MAAARIAAVFLAVLCVKVCAQPAPQGNVTVQVTDPTGAAVPDARIEVDPSFAKPGILFSTDHQGQSDLDLPEGSHVLSVTAQGFKKWTGSINVQSGSSLPVTATLALANVTTGGDMRVEAVSEMPPPDSPETVFLPLQPLLNLDPLPLKSAKRRW